MLYNIKKAFATHQIREGVHTIYFEEYGKIGGIPAIFLHGGPGSGCNDSQKAIFDPDKFRVIFLDQRGSGKSSPRGSTQKNTTELLIKDIEKIRKYLKIENWLVVGGSWGSTLAVAYAQKHRKSVNAMILRSLFLGTKNEVEWAFCKAPLIFRPHLIFTINAILKQKKTTNPIYTLGKMLESNNLIEKEKAAKLWLSFESSLSSIKYSNADINKLIKEDYIDKEIKKLPNTPFMEWHYIKNYFFLEENQLHNNKEYLEKITIDIVQGDYDLLCPPSTSYSFSKGLNKCNIHRVENAGHYVSDPGIKEKMKYLLDNYEEI
ncbi:MAG: prolyl aminopeptidase [Rickettsiales bacterium]|nr:prolyl aminopeptidase [Rickettsiales bacterium]OUV81425.1 MAG: hypothetical protein CBC91_02300 [Rickettsiales bacterium TMED131]